MHRTMALKTVMPACAVLALCACGSGSGTTGLAPQHATSSAASRPGCDTLCQQAGPPAGTDAPGCPSNDSARCLPCPPMGCFRVLSRTATVRAGIIHVAVRCVGLRPCRGAFQVDKPQMEPGPRLAAASVTAPSQASQTSELPVASIGARLA